MASVKPVASRTTNEDATNVIKRSISEVDATRRDLARAYYLAPSHSAMEFEIGECLTVIRKAEERLKKAWTELAQTALPFDDD